MRAAGNAGLLSIVVSLLLAALVVVLIYPQSAQEKAEHRKQDRAAARAAAEMKAVRKKAPPPVRIANLRLPPPPVARPVPALPEPAPRKVRRIETVEVAPLRPSAPPTRKKPPPTKTKKISVLTAAAKTPAPPPEPRRTGAQPKQVTADVKSRKAGRTLLRLLEYGKGPSVEIAWPDSIADRGRLYRRLTRCYGMQGAVMDGADRLFAATGPAGAPWKMDLDRYSGFLRAPAGEAVEEESRSFTDIGARHRLSNWRPVRVFPRNVDAVLLGGLQQVIGAAYAGARNITAAYKLTGRRLILDSVRVNGRALAGAVDLTGIASAGCRAGA